MHQSTLRWKSSSIPTSANFKPANGGARTKPHPTVCLNSSACARAKEGNMANPKAFTQRQIEAFERGAAHYEQRFILEYDPKVTTFEQLFEPGYFKLVAGKLSKNAIIRVLGNGIDFDL